MIKTYLTVLCLLLLYQIIYTQNLPILYKNCTNHIFIKHHQTASVSIRNGTMQQDSLNTELFYIKPDTNSCFILIKNGKHTDSIIYKVVEPPTPKIIFSTIDFHTLTEKKMENGYQVRKGDRPSVTVIPPLHFQKQCPKDAIYHIGDIRCYKVTFSGKKNSYGSSGAMCSPITINKKDFLFAGEMFNWIKPCDYLITVHVSGKAYKRDTSQDYIIVCPVNKND